MSVDSIIKKAIEPIVPICKPSSYKGDAAEYCTFNYTEIPGCFADDAPEMIRYLVQLHWFLPVKDSPMKKKKQIKKALFAKGFTYPSVENVSDGEGQHYVFEMQYVEGVDEDG